MKSMKFKVINRKEWDTITQQFHRYQKEIEDATTFVQEIERGNLDADFVGEHFSGSGRLLMESMLRMRDEMKRLATEDKKRSWVNEGLASFVDTLRSQNDNLESLADNIIRHLVHYLKANQGALYLINDENPDDPYIAMEACYAYNRRKFLQQRIEIGEGLAGQVVLEKQTVYLKEVPENFVRITSGLGEALPRNILIVPLKLEEQVFGLIEIASFKMIEDFEIEFVEKLGESIASTISTVRNSERTNKLLQETQLQAEQMRAQEEEVRQNMEELSATQEEMQRILNEVQAQEAFVKGLIDASNDLIISIDREYKIISANKASIDSFKSSGIEVAPGLDMFKLISDEQREMFKGFYDRALGGEDFEVTENYSFGNKVQHVVLSFSPLRNEKAEVIGVVEFTKDISALVEATNEAERLLKASQEDAEELKAQEEELRQNMEELSATQEEMQRILKEVQDQETFVRGLINASNDSIIAIDKEYKILSANKTAVDSYASLNLKITKGFDIFSLFTEEQKPRFKRYYDRALAGELFEVTEHYKFGDRNQYFAVVYSPIRDENGEVTAAVSFGKDVSEMMLAKLQTENSERYIKALLDVSADSIMTLDRDFKVVDFNSVFAESFGQRGITIEKGFEVLSLLGKDERADKIAMYERAFAGETIETIDHLTENGMDDYFSVKHSPIFNQNGGVDHIAIYASDITEATKARKQAEKMAKEAQEFTEQLRAQEEELRQNLEEMNAIQEELGNQVKEVEALKTDLEIREDVFGLTTILSEADLTGTITLANKKLCEVSKYSNDELVGMPHSLLRHPDMPKELFKLFWQTIKRGEVFKGIIKNRAKDGTHYWVDATIVPVKDENGQITKYVGARYHLTNDEMAKEMYNAQAKKLGHPLLP